MSAVAGFEQRPFGFLFEFRQTLRDDAGRAASLSLEAITGGGVRGGVMDPGRFVGLVDRHAAGLELYARQFCDSAEDVVQEVFIELAGQREVPRNVAGWLYAAVKNRALSLLRSRGRRQRHERAAMAEAKAWFEPQLDDRIDAGLAEAALKEIDMELREPIVMHLWGGLSFEEIGAATGVSSSTAHRRYLAGLDRLRQKLRLENAGTETLR